MADRFRIVVCASGGGGNFQALIDARADLDLDIVGLLVDRPCGAIDRAIAAGIPHVVLNRHEGRETLFAEFAAAVPAEVDLIVLAGFMPIIPPHICDQWRGRMINTHPSLLPKYGGKGMYGVKVQEAVMRAGDTTAGCTVHFVTAGVDQGDIILQQEVVVDPAETPWQLGGRIFKEENRLLVEAVRRLKGATPVRTR